MFDLITLNNIEEYFNIKSQRKQIGVYFCRIIGYDEELLKFLRKYQTVVQRKGTYIKQTIPNPDASDVQYLCTIIQANFSINEKTIKSECSNWLKFLQNSQLDLVSQAIYTVLNEIAKKENNINIIKNAYIKFLYWLKYKFENSIKYIGQDEIPKILYEGDIGKYELYMLRILALAGCDVLYINFINEETYRKTDQEGKYSQRILKPIRQKPEIHFSKINLREIEERENILKENSQLPYTLNTNTWMKNDFWDEILKTNTQRNSKLNEISNIFIKYIGIDKKDEYNNRLYSIKNKIEQNKKSYVILENGIPMPSLDEINKFRFQYKSKEDIIFETLKRVNISQNSKINQAIKCGLTAVLQNIKESNLAKIYNISLKLLCWIEKYGKKLFFTYNEKDMPILIFFGNCDMIEATFLCVMANLPLDVIYINPNKSNIDIFKQSLIKDQSQVIELENNETEKMEYPKKEVKVRASTVAYNAERELDTILYTDTGMYRNKQFKNCQAITLKTTFEEIDILWKEEAKYRTGFEVQENKVIVPNIFAKVCGVKNSDTNAYFKSIQELITKNTILIKGFPIIKENTTNEFYNQSYKFVDKDKLKEEEIRKAKNYKYGFLNENTQNLILSKIQEIIDLKLMPQEDLSINQKIVSTLLNLESNTLKILQQFDFTKEIPKIIIIDVNENMATLQDCILLTFFNLIGFDIIIYTPTGYQNIEKYISKNLYEEYQIGDYIYNLDIPKFKMGGGKKQNFLKDLFGRRN